MTEPLPVGIHHGVPRDIYERDPGYRQSTLKAFGAANSPFHFRYEQNNPPKRPAHLRIGDCVDSAIADSAEVHAGKFVIYEDRRQGKVWDAFEEKNADKVILNRTEANTVTDCALALARHDDTQKILAASHKQVVVIAQRPDEIRVKALIDILPDPERANEMLLPYPFDLKTAVDASRAGFSDACFKFGYHIQAASYLDILALAGRDATFFGFIVVETTPPHSVAIYYIQRDSPEYLLGKQRYEEYLARYHQCVQKNEWPSYSSDWLKVSFKPWQLRTSEIKREVLA